MPTVTLANKKQFECQSDTTILASAKHQGLQLEYSCRSGRCGVCKARVISGSTRSIQEEENLTEEDRGNNIILTCCRSAETDVSLDIEDLGRLANIETKTLPCRIDNILLLAADVVHVTLRLPPNNKLSYLPGQYIDLIKGDVRRSYSIANAPRDDEKLEIEVRKVADGIMSDYFFTKARENDLLRLEGPLGTFCLRDTEMENIIFLATGTGIAPVRAMLEELATDPELALRKNIHVYWGGRFREDIYWAPHFANIHLIFHPVLSQPDGGWIGRTGYVQDAVVEDVIALGDSVVYACGSEDMIESAKESLCRNGLSQKHFYSDAFVSSN
jgi:CDP-4-dehydro-6-deoxyglucose reductase